MVDYLSRIETIVLDSIHHRMKTNRVTLFNKPQPSVAREDFICKCGRRMGTFVDPGNRICGWCAATRFIKNIKPNQKLLVRREVYCLCGCEKLIGWTDFPETVSPGEVELRSLYYNRSCKPRSANVVFAPKKSLWALAAMSYTPTPSPNPWFGNGSDGAFTLGGDATTAQGDNVKHYTTLDVGSHILDHDFNDFGLIIYCAKRLNGNGGKITSDTMTGASNGGASVKGSGVGGNGGGGAGFIAVYAKRMSGSGIIGGARSGTNGGNGIQSTSANFDAGLDGGNVTDPTKSWIDINLTEVAAQKGVGGNFTNTASSGGAGGTGAKPNQTAFQKAQQATDILRWLFPTGLFDSNATDPSTVFDTRMNVAMPAAGGGSGASVNVNGDAGGGGGGGGGAWYGPGGAGGNSGAFGNPGSTQLSTGGGGGGGGGAVPLTVGFTLFNESWSLNSDGGNGGNGGNGNGIAGGGGGGGGGGSGGIAASVSPLSNPLQCTAKAGAKGTAGAGGTIIPQDGVDGTAGKAHTLEWSY